MKGFLIKRYDTIIQWWNTHFSGYFTHQNSHYVPQEQVSLSSPYTGKPTTSSSSPSGWTPGQMTVFWLIGVGIVYAAYLAFQSLHILYLIIAALLISVAMESFILFFRQRVPRGVAIAISYLLLFLFVLTGVVIILPFVLQQLSSIMTIVIQYFYTMGQQISTLGLLGYVQSVTWLPNIIQNYIINFLTADTMNIQSSLMNNISTVVATGSDYAKNIGGFAISFVGSFFSVLGQLGLVLTIAVLCSLEKDRILDFFIIHTSSTQERVHYMAQKVDIFYRKMGLWLKSQLGLCLYIAIIVYVVLLVLSLFGISLPNIGSLALMAGFTEFIPYLGPILGAIPAVIVATSLYGWKGLIVVSMAYMIVQWIENNVLIPVLMNKSLGVSSLLIFLCALIGGSVLGFIGVLLAVPFAVVITMVVKKDFK